MDLKKMDERWILKVMDEQEECLLCPPADFSFKNIASENDILNLRPRINRTGKVPQLGKGNKFVTNTVWLSNNLIETTDTALSLLPHILEIPLQLAWLDLSFNKIYDIGEAIRQYYNIKILYLHGNLIQNVSAISILKALPKLRSLTLHGNPIDLIPQYRSIIVNMLPHITNLDFCHIIDSEKKELLILDNSDKPNKKIQQNKA